MFIKKNPTYQVSLYIGSKERYGGKEFSKENLISIIQTFQNDGKSVYKIENGHDIIPVRVTPTEYVAGDYNEAGWEVTAIMYPRRPRPVEELRAFMLSLATHLLHTFNQNRISVITPDTTYMVQQDEDNKEE